MEKLDRWALMQLAKVEQEDAPKLYEE